MNTLIKHIEYLLTKHDCIIVPGLGGFVSSYKESSFNNDIITPPTKALAFNPSLSHNDGLLASSLMSARNISFNEAMIIINSCVKEWNESLNEGNVVSLGSIGELKKDDHNLIQFIPCRDNFFDLNLFGFERLTLTRIDLNDGNAVDEDANEKEIVFIPVNMHLLKRVSSIAAIIILMLFVSHPLDEGNIPDNYASLISAQLIKNAIVPSVSETDVEKLLGDTLLNNSDMFAELGENNNNISVSNEVVSQALNENEENASLESNNISLEKKEENIDVLESDTPHNVDVVINDPEIKPLFKNSTKENEATLANNLLENNASKKAASKKYYIIVGSFPSEKQAVDRIKYFDKKGLSGIDYLNKDNKYRLYINSFSNKDEANRYLEILRSENDNFKDAWLLAAKG
ncbi:MAG: SPOR domain-containing protein [Bacteroidales bacterium]|nr:SPOR domain-containing protein [Bacteroidales bacterium]